MNDRNFSLVQVFQMSPFKVLASVCCGELDKEDNGVKLFTRRAQAAVAELNGHTGRLSVSETRAILRKNNI
jgi:hypothetical protein